jgi:predicted nucleic acid-binding protein
VLRSADPAAAHGALARLLRVMPVLPISRAVARRCAELRERLRVEGRRVHPRALDLLIAATALEHQLALVTRNREDYADIADLVLY